MSDAGHLDATFKCLVCGGAILELPDDYTDDSIAKCESCGERFGRYGDIKAKAMDLAKKKVVADFRNAFKGMKGSKFK